MVYTILISIVFVAEVIITITLYQVLRKFDKTVLELDETVTELKPGIKDISELSRKLSEQTLMLSKDFVDNIKKRKEDILAKQFSKILLGVLLLKLNSQTIKRLKNSKVIKAFAKGLSLFEIVV